VLHVLEELELLQDEKSDRSSRVLQPFMRLRDINSVHGAEELRRERYAVIEAIGQRFTTVDYQRWEPLYRLFRPFLEHFNLDHFSLNYDLLSDITTFALSNRTGKPWFNGFPSVADDPTKGASFLSDVYAKPESKQIYLRTAHLHGSVAFGYKFLHTTTHDTAALELVELDLPAAAMHNWQVYHRWSLENGTSLAALPPIVSGLRKADKLNVRPYGNYLQGLAQALSKNSCLLVVGYGGRDAHLNFWIKEFLAIHKTNARLIEVTIEKDPNEFLLNKLVELKLAWKKERSCVFLNGDAPVSLTINCGIGADVKIPVDMLVSHATS
jgi:hypothetical protein